MLTADLVRARRQGDQLHLSALTPKLRDRAQVLAAAYLELAHQHLQCPREDLEQAWQSVEVRASERKLALALRKLVEDRCNFEVHTPLAPVALRRALFAEASRVRRQLPEQVAFDRARLVRDHAQRHELAVDALEQALYADLRHAQLLLRIEPTTAGAIVEAYPQAQLQAVLLRAVNLNAQVRCQDAHVYRALFHKLKFLRLLHRIEPLREGGYRIEIDGPFSLFGPVTKYGLQLALALPALQACEQWALDAELRWGPTRDRLRLHVEGRGQGALGEAVLGEEARAVLERFRALETRWDAHVNSDILELPGVGLCIPDLKFHHRDSGEIAYLEVLGYWSRQAVWRRVELAQAGLPHRIVFAASSRLRVDEGVLDAALPASLYMFKGVLHAKEVLQRIEATSPSLGKKKCRPDSER